MEGVGSVCLTGAGCLYVVVVVIGGAMLVFLYVVSFRGSTELEDAGTDV